MSKRFLFAVVSMLFSVGAVYAQYTGTVKASDDPEPVIGANVVIQGTTVGTITDFDGLFEIEAKSGDVLEISYMGYQTQLITLGANKNLTITLEPENTMLEEFVAVGYGTMKKSDVTGAVASVKTDQLVKAPVAGLDQALQGRVAGVTVTNGSGQPGQGATIRIRGIGSAMGGNDPLYVVDGVITSDIKFLSPNDIKSMEILKDASATAIYGSRGANGVILITTKSGEDGKANISFDAYWGFQNRWKKLDLMGSEEMALTKLKLAVMKNGWTGGAEEAKIYAEQGLDAWVKSRNGTSQYFPTNFDYGAQNTDWQDAVFKKNAFMHNYNLSIDGGNEKGHYAFSASYFSQEGTIIGSNYNRLTLRLNSDYQIFKWLKFGEHFSFMHSEGRNAMNNSSSAGASVISAALAMAPWDPTHYPQGARNSDGDDLSGRIAASSNFTNVTNPFTMLEESDPKNKTNRFVGDLYLEITPIQGLTIRPSISTDYNIVNDRNYKGQYNYSTYDKAAKNYLSSNINTWNTLLEELTITYARQIGKHSFSVMGGQTWSLGTSYGIGGAGSMILNPVEANRYLFNTTEDRTYASDNVGRDRRLSFLARGFYNYDSRYMITVNFRADASSRFRKNPWGFFPSVAVAWRLSEEPFLRDKELGWLDNIKFRAGWGQVGNDGGSSSFVTTMGIGGSVFYAYPLGSPQTLNYGAAVLTLTDENGKWETNEQWDAGIDFGFWNGMLSGSIDYFLRDTKDALLYVNAPAYVGNRFSMVKNVGIIRNQGVELTLEHAHKVGEFSYSIGANLSWVKNELRSLNGGSELPGDKVMTSEGMPLNSFWGYKYLGIFANDIDALNYFKKNDPSLKLSTATFKGGDAIYQDVNQDGKIDTEDQMNIGNPFPMLTFGLNFSAEFYGVDVQLFFQGVYGNKIYNAVRLRTEGAGDECTLSTSMRNAWIGYNADREKMLNDEGLGWMMEWENRNGSIPNPAGASANMADNSRFLEDGSYLRLKNLTIGYTLPKKVTEKFFCKRLRFYMTASNLFTITKYSGYDPEVGGGVDYGNYPQSRTFIFGLNANF